MHSWPVQLYVVLEVKCELGHSKRDIRRRNNHSNVGMEVSRRYGGNGVNSGSSRSSTVPDTWGDEKAVL